jgi:hypothetical protein
MQIQQAQFERSENLGFYKFADLSRGTAAQLAGPAALSGSIRKFIQTDSDIRRLLWPDAALLSTAPDRFDYQD